MSDSTRVYKANFVNVPVSATLAVNATADDSVSYRGSVWRSGSDSTFTWGDKEIEDGVEFALTKKGDYLAEIFITFVKAKPKEVEVVVTVDGKEKKKTIKNPPKVNVLLVKAIVG